ncbi:hypothetical protein PYW07_008077 [Mythimna separata]|uniref:Dynein regulatory complex protein 9 n=1 Tax=Mythimna separata TaxID=271217 RepID=A0AAD8DUJ9_MYTSE|nr:hypothetical protein PYW07_008077 [Mythimna separata]
MSKIVLLPGAVEPSIYGLVSDHHAEQVTSVVDAEAIPESITTGMVLRPIPANITKLDVINVSKSVSGGSSFMLTSLFTSILEDVLTQLWILERCNNGLALVKTLSDYDYLKAIKYGVYDANEVKDELEGIDPKNLNCTIYKIKKLDSDRKYVNKVMIGTYMGLAQSFSFDNLVSFIRSYEKLELYRINLEEEETKNKQLRRELSKQVRQQRNHIKTVLYDTEVIINKLRTQIEDSVLYSEVRSRYIDNWQVARTEQHEQTIYDIEYDPATNIEYYKRRTDHEFRVHNEVETLVTITINETLEKIEEWMEKFEIDMDKIDLKIQMKKNEYQNAREKRIKYEEKLECHQKRMNEWIEFKTAREIARKYREKMLTSAIIVQAWWRGLLVRLSLGPYKKPNKPKPKKK